MGEHQVALIKDNTLHFQEDKLPSLNLSELIHTNTKSDLLADIFYPVYSGQKISLQCINPQFVTIDKVKRYCDSNSLHFIDFPKQIMAGNVTILVAHVPHHFSSRLDFMNTDFRSVSLFRKTNQSDLTIVQDIVTFFEQATPIHYSLIVTVFCLMMLLLILLFCVCYLKIPQC